VEESIQVPLPRWPWPLYPQQRTVWSWSTAQVVEAALLRATALSRPETVTGWAKS